MNQTQILPLTLHNFGAGPSHLPRTVLEQASQALLDFNGTGMSILEIGHRTSIFQAVMDEALALLRKLMELDADHEPLFLHGGASTQFFQVPMNLLDEQGVASYTDTGIWASKAIKEAKLFGKVHVAGSSKENLYKHLPHQLDIAPNSTYLHITTNNTVYGTQWRNLEELHRLDVPLVADMSSDILSRPLDFNRYTLIYAGAQKNIGAAGVNVVVVNKNALGKVSRALPTMMDYRNHIENGSMLNTPPVFAIYTCLLTLRWLDHVGGPVAMAIKNQEKADLLYNTLDQLPLFKPTVAKEDRSLMNAVFTIADPAVEKEFLALCEKENMIGIKGHRTTGGFRVSLYNAISLESVQALTDLMHHFAQTKG